ncbi:stage II sporulation protein P [Cohnella massiliensis]|uniref:stage II sporulation protein P n=1 Tax=Cohnella massiliensis TaxID=1816691 RepID=UPI0009BAADF3|nr:stage II sporulation protein P [Cohnella massiliensis]
MKRNAFAPQGPRMKYRFRRMLVTGKAYLTLSLVSMIVVLMLGLGGILQNVLATSPVQTMKGFASSVSASFFSSLLGMELPHMDKQRESSGVPVSRLAAFLVRWMTELNPNDPKSLLALEMPGVNRDSAVLLRPGSGGGAEAPEDHGPGHNLPPDAEGGEAGTPPDGSGGAAEPPDGQPEPTETPAPGTEGQPDPEQGTGGRKVAFIYHSHNQESWFPELKEGTKDPNSKTVNITLVGKRMAEQLEKLGIGAVHSDEDYSETVQNYNWNYSYKYSHQTVKDALAENKELEYFFDIHRDSQRRSKTTVTIDGVSYAQVYFIIGHRNPNWEQNEAFANSIHQLLEEKYPGLSRGIWGKTAATGNGEYNQSISPDSVLIEIGGVDNTLAECYRTADALAKAIAEIYWDERNAVKADASAASGGSSAKGDGK